MFRLHASMLARVWWCVVDVLCGCGRVPRDNRVPDYQQACFASQQNGHLHGAMNLRAFYGAQVQTLVCALLMPGAQLAL